MISPDDVKYISQLAHLRIPDEQVPQFQKDLNQILGYVDQLSELDEELAAKDVQPMMHAWQGKGTPLRDDVPRDSLDKQDVLAQAPQTKGEAFAVPKIIE